MVSNTADRRKRKGVGMGGRKASFCTDPKNKKLKKIFLTWTNFKVFNGFVTTLFLFYVYFFGSEACGIVGPWPRIKPTPPANAGLIPGQGPKIPHASQPGKVPQKTFYKNFNTWVVKGKPVYINRFDLYIFSRAYSVPEMLMLAVAIPSRWVTLYPGCKGRDGSLKWLAPNHKAGEKACLGVWTQGWPL